MLDTFPKYLVHNAQRFADRPAIREKDLGIWQTWSWNEMKDEIFALANGLASIGFGRGDKLAIVGANRPRLYWGMAAAQSLGGIPVPIYADSVAEEMKYVLNHAEVDYILAEDQEQVDKAMEVWDQCPGLKKLIYDDPRGMRDYDHDLLYEFRDIQQAGREFAGKQPDFLEKEINRGKGSDIAIFLYTSGTTGHPKGVVLTHDNVLITAVNSAKQDNLTEHEEMLSYLPPAWVGDHIFSYGQAYVTGFCINCPESASTVANDLREIGPTFYFAPPKVFENLLTTGHDPHGGRRPRSNRNCSTISWQWRKRWGLPLLNGEPVSLADRLRYRLGNWLIFAPLKNTMGFSRIRVAYTAGEAIGPRNFRLFPFPGDQYQTALRPDRGRGIHHHPAGRRSVRRYRG